VGGGLLNSVSLAELTKLCTTITGNRIDIDSTLANRPGDLPIYITDNSKVTNFCQWKPEITVEELLIEIFDWLKKDEKQLRSILS
jgi:CDP-paratose 2-epimerase